MPRFMSEISKSPERIPYHLRCKPSTPIEIPILRRPSSSPLNSSEEPKSPDMIFEMSPVSPTFPSLSKMYPNSGNSTTETNTNEPFMYHIPTFRRSPQGNGTQLRSKIARRVMPSKALTTVPAKTEFLPARSSEGRSSRDERIANAHAGFPQPTASQTTTKISGFTPLIDHQPPMAADQPSRPTIPLSPPSRRGSYSSPWILPGRSDRYEEDISYSLADPGPLEFRQHLLRRIECQDSSRMKSLHSCL
ncbi:hypothetical protein M413DRAFT_444054 [Hebeloma cylindrosporum]|uniref:Uncharacterized protein n=1 Tax=Hebeloma cylindrosporum TaxID=76867 RepID=A0A0C3C2W0_HEBCY|nr:hypothetical protein M413DRAFT_444054 [Hebeloma cylindrosporum h7]